MEKFDEQLEQRVWQRIHGEVKPASLQALAAAERSCAAAYLRLARMVQGPEKGILRQLFERERQHGKILNGLSIAQSGQALSIRTVPPAADSLQVALRKCYAASLKAAAEYRRCSADVEHGAVFAHLAQQEQEHCVMILEILGGEQRRQD